MKLFNVFKKFKQRFAKSAAKVAGDAVQKFADAVDGPQKKKKDKLPVYRLEAGGYWNPLTSYPRNKGCFCGSGEKAKKCCLPLQKRAINAKFAGAILGMWDDILTGHSTLPPHPESKGWKAKVEREKTLAQARKDEMLKDLNLSTIDRDVA